MYKCCMNFTYLNIFIMRLLLLDLVHIGHQARHVVRIRIVGILLRQKLYKLPNLKKIKKTSLCIFGLKSPKSTSRLDSD